MLIEFGLGDANGGIEIVVGKLGIQNVVTTVLQVGRLEAAWGRLPTVEEDGGQWVSLLDIAAEVEFGNRTSRFIMLRSIVYPFKPSCPLGSWYSFSVVAIKYRSPAFSEGVF